MILENSSLVSGSDLITSKFFLRFSIFFMPTIVEMRHLIGMDLTSCRCFETGSLMFLIWGISTSLTLPSNSGLLDIKFIWRRLQMTTSIFMSTCVYPEAVVAWNSCHFSVKASGIATPMGTWMNLKPCLSLQPICSANSIHFWRLKYILSSSIFALKQSHVAIP